MSANETVDYWFFVHHDNCFKWAVIEAPDMSLDDAKLHIKNVIGKPVLDIGYGKEVPIAFSEMPTYDYSVSI